MCSKMIRSTLRRRSSLNHFTARIALVDNCYLTPLQHQQQQRSTYDIYPIIVNERRKQQHISSSWIFRRLYSTQQQEQNNNNNFRSTDETYTKNQKNKQNQKQQSVEKLTKYVEFDFFGEPVTFLQGDENASSTTTSSNNNNINKIRSNSMAAIDGFLLCVVSKGKTCTFGGGEGGLEIKSAHSSAIAWTEALINSMIWNHDDKFNSSDIETSNNKDQFMFASTMIAPMLAVVTVAPILVQTGIAYMKHLDTLLRSCKSRVPGLPPVQMIDIAYNAIQYKDDTKQFNERECMHLQALYHLLQDQYSTALMIYLKILRSCPGDALAVSLAMDLSLTLGDKQAALRYVF
jgi:hypothetical protein